MRIGFAMLLDLIFENFLIVLKVIVLILFSFVFEARCFIQLRDFYPYGARYGDNTLPVNDDNSSAPMDISMAFPFFGQPHSSIIVNTNGILSFVDPVEQYTSDPFPISHERRVVAPFWADVDTRRGGDVWYRESRDPTLLQRVTSDVRKVFPDIQQYVAKWMLIATWDEVSFYGASEIGQNKTNNFQAILTTDGVNSFAIFLYNKVQWTTGSASGGNQSTGLGGTEAQVGFNAGDGVHYYSVQGSRTPAILNLTSLSNVHIPGEFVFRIDEEYINECQTSPCVNGICTPLNFSYVCHCPEGFSGTHCTIKTHRSNTGVGDQGGGETQEFPGWFQSLEMGMLATIFVALAGISACLCYRCCGGCSDNDDDDDDEEKGWSSKKRPMPAKRPIRFVNGRI